MREVELVADVRAELGECPRWHAGKKRLYFVDIAAQRLHRLDPATGTLEARGFDEPVGCFGFRDGGGLVIAGRDGFALLDSFKAAPRPLGLQAEADRPHSRFNDGRVDPQGRFWAGTLDSTKAHDDAALYRLDPDGGVSEQARGALTSNGLAFSPDGSTLYYADTPRHLIRAYDLASDGAISRPRLFHQFPHGEGRPDGASVDVEGCYWTALYAGARVARLSPTGEILEEVAIPAGNPTMIAFGGDDLRTAFVTSARGNTSEADLAQFPHAGGVFSFRVDAPGLPETDFGG